MSSPFTPDNPYLPPKTPGGTPPPTPQGEGDATGGVIPYKNPAALTAYYLGLFSLLPCLGILLAIPAFILGIIGLRKRKQNPAIRGGVHAWIGVIMGGLFTLIWGAMIVLGIIGAIANQ